MDLSLLDRSSQVTPLIVRLYDSHRLYSLAETDEPEARQELTTAVCELLEMELSPREHELVADVLIALMNQAEEDLRMALSERLSALHDVPLRLVLHLSNDDISVAAPMLKNSIILSDMDLLYIIKSKTAEYWQAIATRRVLSDHIIGVLADTKDVSTAIALAENESIFLDDSALVKLSDMAQSAENLATPLLRRPEVDSQLAASLYRYVGAAMQSYIEQNFEVSDAVRMAVSETFESMAGMAQVPGGKDTPTLEMIGAAKAMKGQGRLTITLMIKTLRRGDFAGFTAQLSCYSGIAVEPCVSLLGQQGVQGIAAICRVAGIDKADFLSLFILAQRYRSGHGNVNVSAISGAVDYYSHLPLGLAQEIIRDAGAVSSRMH